MKAARKSLERVLGDLKGALGQVPEDELPAVLNAIRAVLHEKSPLGSNPVDFVQWVPVEKVVANDYNPNAVAKIEMQLLYTSIKNDGYTQPVVVVRDDENDRWVIVDGFHRSAVMKGKEDIRERCRGLLPVVVLDKGMNDRMASTVRHNRARGKHNVGGMSNMIFEMLDNGWADEEICQELGMEAEELLRLKHITGFAKLFKDREYNRAWVTKRQVMVENRRRGLPVSEV